MLWSTGRSSCVAATAVIGFCWLVLRIPQTNITTTVVLLGVGISIDDKFMIVTKPALHDP